ncbi:MAG TPA: tryptophan--tRNA ligase [Candidatus Saccharimonadales bacterium]|nr:tryptophan--tRNA ligase [Candidatus Saccharimonadales bacterium]
MKETILTGIRANNDLHIGNYFGALLPMIDMAKKHSDEYEINLFVPDLHSFTTPIDHSKLQAQILHNLRLFVAAGLPLDNDSIHIYRQSYIPAHSELTWILDCFTGFGEMRRMTQFKDKAQKATLDVAEADNPEHIRSIAQDLFASVSVGLFNYPVLMAADILLYGAKYVPVGDDQTQHLEFTRDIATRMNNQFGELFVVPEPVAKQHEFFGKDQGLRIKDLVDPTKKMSKSDESGRGIIFLGDNPDDAAKKIMSATTDSESSVGNPDMQTRPGVANLVQILKLLDPNIGDVSNLGYKDFKEKVANSVKDFLNDFQAKLASVDEQAIMQKLEADESAMTKIAGETLLSVQRAVGLRPKE